MLLPEQKPSLVWLCPALCNNQTAETVQQSTLKMAEVQNTNECLTAVFLLSAQWPQRANLHTQPSPAPPSMAMAMLLLHTVCQETKGQLRHTILNLDHLASP